MSHSHFILISSTSASIVKRISITGTGTRLTTINLSRNKNIRVIEDGAFSYLSYLTTLLISSTGITEPPRLDDCLRLTNLDLSSNAITRYVSATRFPSSLIVLRLNHNQYGFLSFIRVLLSSC